MFALDLNIKPFCSRPIMDSNSFFVCCNSFFICSYLPSSLISPISFVSLSILDLRFFSNSCVSFLLCSKFNCFISDGPIY